jgi:hypothetical protein
MCALLKTWIGTLEIEARIAFAAVGGRDVIAELEILWSRTRHDFNIPSN